jgi:acyl carrier protein
MSLPEANPSVARDQVESSLRRFFEERSRGAVSADSIDSSLHLYEAGYIDSMNALTLLDYIEERYGVVVPEVELVGRLSTLATLIDFVVARRSQGA